MLNKKLEEALNAQINAEFWSAYLYLSMSSDMSEWQEWQIGLQFNSKKSKIMQ